MCQDCTQSARRGAQKRGAVNATLFVGEIITMSEERPRAGAVLVDSGRIVGVGSEAELAPLVPAGANTARFDGVMMPGLIEPHGHPTSSAAMLGPGVTDIRPVVLATAAEVMRALGAAIAERPAGVLANGWDPLLQRGLENPTIATLDALAGATPLVIVHNSGHSAFFNSAAAQLAEVTRDTPDPAGASYERDAAGELTGVAHEVGAVFGIAAPLVPHEPHELASLVREELARANAAGVTTIADLSWNPVSAPLFAAARADTEFTARLRGYEMSRPGGSASVPLRDGDDMVRQIGIKTWADGSPWVGNIATSFPYLDTAATRGMGLAPGHRGAPNFSEQQIYEIALGYARDGWQLACHAHGDLAVDSVLNAWQRVITELDLGLSHRFRLEHCGAMTAAQFERAAAMGVTASVFVDHVRYWGDVLVDDLFGEPGARWADAAAAFDAGVRATFHNDGTVTPLEPFTNMSVAMTRLSRSSRRLSGAAGVSIGDAMRAHTVNAAWQLFEEENLGSIEPGKYADLIVIDRDPYAVPAADVAATRVLATYLAGELVFAADA